MIKLFRLFLLLMILGGSAFAQTSYNAIATAYVTTTISQNVVFNDTMRQGGTFTMSVLAHNGGGRAGQSDTANVRIQFYNSSGGLMGTFQSSYSNNLPNPNAVCGNPCIDTAVPWSTLTVSTTVDAASAANIAYAKVSMYGIDGSYWAGDYGPWYRAPTFQHNGGGNLLYNPEFGPYNGVTAQGWTSSPGFGACQGAWGGSNACIVNSDGVPGSSTVGLVANANGGGPDANGGTTSGTAGGYNNTMTTTNAGTGATAGSTPAGPTVVSTSTSNQTSTSSSSSNTSNITISRPTTTGTFTDVYVGTTTVTTTTTTPVTTTTYSDGSTTTSNGTPTTTSATTYTITPTLGTAPTYSRAAPNIGGNSVYVKQIYSWNNTQVSITQEGNNNAVTGTDSGWATVDGNGSIISIQQYGQGNIVGTKMNAWGNNIDIKQKGASGGDVNNNLFNLESFGNGNAVTIQQQTNNNTASVKMTYDINTANITQKGSTGNSSYITMVGNWNTVNETQNGSNNLSLVNISGDQNSVSINQTGNNHSALLNLIGNKNNVSVTQTGTGDAYSLQQTCTNPAGCSVSVIRNK